MSEVVQCPQCNSSTWLFTPKTEKRNYEAFQCVRCNYQFKPGKCRVCGTKKWERIQFEIHTRNPVVKYRCTTCGRIITILIDY